MIDLHTHSTFSDGSLTPAALVDLARREGLCALALTDHDTTAGLAPFLEACAAAADGAAPLRAVPGVEISVDVTRGTMHVLGYFVRAGDPQLEPLLARIRDGRDGRNGMILNRLRELGMPLDAAEVESRAGGEVVGRPHIAQAMVARGYVRSTTAAFDRFLAKGQPAYCDRYHPPPKEGIAAIRAAGGAAVLAHPWTLEMTRSRLQSFVGELRTEGLAGIEVWYPEHSAEQRDQYLGLCREFDLIAVGGSDFHGAMNPALRLGHGFNGLGVPDSAVDDLAARATAVRKEGPP
jgi:predicted metal-dependent phosphoesterase TrpH